MDSGPGGDGMTTGRVLAFVLVILAIEVILAIAYVWPS